MFEHMEEILTRVQREHFLEGSPTGDELEEHIPAIIPPSLKNYVKGFKASGNIVTIYVTDSVSRVELSLHAPEMAKLLNARLGRNAVGRIRARVKK